MTGGAIILLVVATTTAPVAGALLVGTDRKVTARIQGRIGPPIIQPIYDVIKLLGKEPIVLNRTQIVYAWLHLSLMALAVAMLALGEDMLMILFVHAFATISLIMGGMCVRSPYSRIGSLRAMMQMLAYEPILLLLVVGVYLVHGTFVIRRMHSAGPPLLVAMPLVFVAFLMVMAVKMEKSPFDISTSHHAHQELIKGVTLEYSGPFLAMIEVAHFYEVALAFAVVVLFWTPNLGIGGALAAGAFFLMTVIDNTMARLTTLWVVRAMWSVPVVLALTNVCWLYWKVRVNPFG